MKYRFNPKQPYTLEISSPDRERWRYLGNFKSLGNAYRKAAEWRYKGFLAPGACFYIQGPMGSSHTLV
jgi:hypothetical protein